MSNQNPFAAALGATGGNQSSRSFTEALSNSSGRGGAMQAANQNHLDNNPFGNPIYQPGIDQFGGTNGPMQDFGGFPGSNNYDAYKKQEELRKQELEQKRLALHKKISPLTTTELFNAREQQTRKQIASIRADLKRNSRPIETKRPDISVTIAQETTSPGFEGASGITNFFHHLAKVIQFEVSRARSAAEWADQSKNKKKKIANRAKGLGKQMAESSGFEQRANMDQFFNSERGDNFGE